MPAVTEPLVVAGGRYRVVPAGAFLRGGSSTPDESPASRVFLSAYAIGETPVTNAEYRRFVERTGHRRSPLADDPTFGGDSLPAVAVSWHDAVAYCAWLSSETGRDIGLPTEAQWEKAARGIDGRVYPWGDGPPSDGMLNIGHAAGATTPVGAFGTTSPYGLLDCLGNVWEWCADWYESDYYRVADQADPLGPAEGSTRTTRGGSWRSDPFRATCSHRCFMHPSVRSDRIGFRVRIGDVAAADLGGGAGHGRP